MVVAFEQAFIQRRHPFVRDLCINLYSVYLKHRRFGSGFASEFEQIQKMQSLTATQVRENQFLTLKKILSHAYAHVEFYGRRFSEYGICPEDVKDPDDLERLPTLSREDIYDNSRDLIADNIAKRDYVFHSTSGTSGQKLRFAISKHLQWAVKFATLYTFYSWAGVSLGDRRVTLGGRVFAGRPPFWTYNRAENQLLLSIHHLKPWVMRQYLEVMEKFKPVFVQGHPSGTHRLAEWMICNGKVLPVRAVFTTGETIYADQRLAIEQAFQCKVFDFYGQGEGVFFAAECECHGGLHELSNMGIIETKTDPQTGLAEVIGTSLHNYAMPMIRYRIGDLARPLAESRCPCGRGFPLKLAKVIGRTDDRIYLSRDGEDSILPVTIRMALKPFLREGQNYQLVQRDFDDFLLTLTSPRVAARRSPDRTHLFRRTLRELLGDKCTIELNYTDSLTTSGGKTRNVVSLVDTSHTPNLRASRR
jgi:phenylacetate-CoA ligase